MSDSKYIATFDTVLRALTKEGICRREIGNIMGVSKGIISGRARRLEITPSTSERGPALSTAEIAKYRARFSLPANGILNDPAWLNQAKTTPSRRRRMPHDIEIIRTPAKVESHPSSEHVAKVPVPFAMATQAPPPETMSVHTRKRDGSSSIRDPRPAVRLHIERSANLPDIFREPNPCCFPIGTPKRASFHFCNAPAIRGKPYCEEHASIAYLPAEPKRKGGAEDAA